MKTFEESAELVSMHASSLDKQQLLKLYGLYKVSTEGSCTRPKPNMFEWSKLAKWQSWSEASMKSGDEARLEYVKLVTALNLPQFTKKGVVVSSLIGNDKDDLKDIFSLARAGDLTTLKIRDLDTSEVDKDGMTLLHWAADRGHLEVLKYLLQVGFVVDKVDNEGCSPLHHAGFSGHQQCFKVLAESGASVILRNNDGEVPAL
jgi:acyl-CoA-binding protein